MDLVELRHLIVCECLQEWTVLQSDLLHSLVNSRRVFINWVCHLPFFRLHDHVAVMDSLEVRNLVSCEILHERTIMRVDFLHSIRKTERSMHIHVFCLALNRKIKRGSVYRVELCHLIACERLQEWTVL